MEIYKSLSDPASKEFEKLLNSQHSKSNVEEGKIIEGKVNKITDKYVFLYIENMKSEPVLDRNELRQIGLGDKIELNQTIPVLVERLEDKFGEVVVSASKAQKIKGWGKLVKAYEANEPIMGRITARCKGGCIVEHIDTGSLMFLPGSQIDSKPLKNIDHLMNVSQKFALIKLDRARGNACVSRREILSSNKKEDKAKIIGSYKIGDLIKNAECKAISSFGAFFSTGPLDVLVHLQELSWSRIDSPEQILEVGQIVPELKVISVDHEKLQVGCSLKQMTSDPFGNIDNYELNKVYKAKVMKFCDFGIFCELEPGLTTLLHSSELSWTKKNVKPQTMFKLHQEISVYIQEIDREKRRVAVSYRLTQENPYEAMSKLHPIDSIDEAEVVSKNDYALFVKFKDLDCLCFLHVNDLTFLNNGEEELAKYKKGSKLNVRVLEIKPVEQKIRVSHRATLDDPFDYFNDRKQGDVLTVKVISTTNKEIIVRPIDCKMDFPIKKSALAMNPADARPSRWTGGEKVDCCIAEIKKESRKVTLSIKLLEEQARDEALKKFGTTAASGKSLPFSNLADDLANLKKKKDDTKD